MKNEIKKAIESAEQEIQEREIANLKSIIKDLLENKQRLEKNKRNIESQISVIKQTIDDFKTGRLDKIKELQEKDETAKETLPFEIIIVNQPVITQPWNWQYQVVRNYPTNFAGTSLIDGVSTTYCTAGTNTLTAFGGLSGNGYATFTSGSYNVGGAIVNLN